MKKIFPELKLRVLQLLCSEDLPLDAHEIGEKLKMDKHNIGQQLNVYRLQGIVRRTKHYDILNTPSKEYYYSITEKGRDRLNFLKDKTTQEQNHAMS